jgi:hypothetical protein
MDGASHIAQAVGNSNLHFDRVILVHDAICLCNEQVYADPTDDLTAIDVAD